VLNYPLDLSYKYSLTPQVRVTDAAGQRIAYVKRKAFKLKENVTIFADEAQQRPLFRMQADRIFGSNVNYAITRPDGTPVGSVQRQDRRSWKAIYYSIADTSGGEIGLIRRELKVADALEGKVPVVEMLEGVFLNPAYLVDLRGANALYLKKQTVVLKGKLVIEWESKFVLERRGDLSDGDEALALSSVIMALMLEQESRSGVD